jgi:tetratricopeptide (TPR) repeat protein
MVTKSLLDEVFDLIYGKNRTEDAILKLNGIIKSSPENSRAIALKAYALNKLANLHREWNYSQMALEFAERALSLNPSDDIALTSKGWALIDLGRATMNTHGITWHGLNTFPGTHLHQQELSEARSASTLTTQS